MKKGLIIPTISLYLFLAALLVRFILTHNYEFMGYVVVVGVLYAGILVLDKKYDFPLYAVWLYIGWAVLHILGGIVMVVKTRLYDLVLFEVINRGGEFVILKYDQFVHAYCYFAFVILIYYVLREHINPKNTRILIIFSLLSAMGIGLLNEIIEFGLVIWADAATTIGGYDNTALDLVFNLLGAIIGVVFLWLKEKE